MAHEEIAETYDFMNSANGVLIVADHDCFLHTSNTIIMVHTLCNVRRRLSFSCSNNKATTRLFNFKNKELAKIPTRAAITAFGTNFICSDT